ncbi:hypothetical protein FOZ63_010657 [Perkinsus olseni]|uniref:Uncharacterized protein n=1 Tax=Perkinsus olseni TaxID=32597 RepID=A0A7J6NPH4_PEROL|nr:hypothetical protein FOZ62_012205 [Perkinsus olseni]KAF4726305.1 hypothetical protein FOZ63_010657 [Perkinsus olseni]
MSYYPSQYGSGNWDRNGYWNDYQDGHRYWNCNNYWSHNDNHYYNDDQWDSYSQPSYEWYGEWSQRRPSGGEYLNNDAKEDRHDQQQVVTTVTTTTTTTTVTEPANKVTAAGRSADGLQNAQSRRATTSGLSNQSVAQPAAGGHRGICKTRRAQEGSSYSLRHRLPLRRHVRRTPKPATGCKHVVVDDYRQ